MGIGMVELDQRLVACLEAHRGERRLDLEHGKSLFASGQSALRRLACASAIPPAGIMGPARTTGEHTEIVADAGGITGAVAGSQFPARALPDGVLANFSLNLAIAHPGIVIPRGVVGADMVK